MPSPVLKESEAMQVDETSLPQMEDVFTTDLLIYLAQTSHYLIILENDPASAASENLKEWRSIAAR
jgi:hypothetical protein